jgi:acid phosphatase (class A)
LGLAIVGVSVVVASALGQPPTAQRLPGYLKAEQAPDFRTFVPPPPAPDSPVGAADLAVYRATRALEGQPWWLMAASDAQGSPAALLKDFACGLGVSISPEQAPATVRVLGRASADLGRLIGPSKDFYARPRPFITEPRPICVEPGVLANQGAYPSGHAAVGWLYALVLAELAPERAADLVARGRAYGESRVVCGMHWVSDIEASRMIAAAVVAALNGHEEYRADAASARAELKGLRGVADAPPAAQCSAEHDLLATPW